jgi:Ca2+-binding RTX toxin-like protein
MGRTAGRSRDGNDLLCGDSGGDTLSGGAGDDSLGGGSGTDTATDFTAAEGDTSDGTIPWTANAATGPSQEVARHICRSTQQRPARRTRRLVHGAVQHPRLTQRVPLGVAGGWLPVK